jgi:hypothetical protein
MDGLLDFVSSLDISPKDAHLAIITTTLGSIVLIAFFIWYAKAAHERAIKYSVDEPVACKRNWKGEILEKPSIKVWCSDIAIEGLLNQ